jgi:hypothetical protein
MRCIDFITFGHAAEVSESNCSAAPKAAQQHQHYTPCLGTVMYLAPRHKDTASYRTSLESTQPLCNGAVQFSLINNELVHGNGDN